jgi:hypothetical protein
MPRAKNNESITYEPATRLADLSWEALSPGLQETCQQFMQTWWDELGIEELREMSGLNDMTLSDLLAWEERNETRRRSAKKLPTDDPIDQWFREHERDPAERVLCYLNCDIQHLAEYFLHRLLTEDEFDEAVHAISHLQLADLIEYCIQ